MSFSVLRFLAEKVPTRSIFPRFLTTLRNVSSQPATAEQETSQDVEVKIDPLKHPDYFKVHELFSVSDLFNARVHFGHKIGSLDDNMKPYIFGSRLDHLIIDLNQTVGLLKDALNFIAHTVYRDGLILFVCHNAQITHLVEKTAIECGEFAFTRLWHEGTFTNANYKFEAVTRLPDLCIFLNTLDTVSSQHPGIVEAAKLNIPTVGIVDTNCNPNLITYPIPGNDDSLCAIELYCRLFKTVIQKSKEQRTNDFSKADKTKTC